MKETDEKRVNIIRVKNLDIKMLRSDAKVCDIPITYYDFSEINKLIPFLWIYY